MGVSNAGAIFGSIGVIDIKADSNRFNILNKLVHERFYLTEYIKNLVGDNC